MPELTSTVKTGKSVGRLYTFDTVGFGKLLSSKHIVTWHGYCIVTGKLGLPTTLECRIMKSVLFVVAMAAIGAVPASSAPITVTSYSMPNGSGQASGGQFNYWDRNYSGTGSTTTDGALLSGGTGDLTDGVIAGANWFGVENSAGTGPYVGWLASRTLNPTVTFNFAGTPTINGISIHLDNSGFGGVFAPAAILINNVSQSFTAPPAGTVGFVNFTGLGLAGNSLTVQFQQANNSWAFVSEVSFDGATGAIPEPASWAMLIAGFGFVGAMQRRRRTVEA